ncbi:MAG TPA: hypothetical protein IAC40_07310 [Candidatus Faecivivens stercorigallinarum]|nr:hypothetical protein [Candidatus Faecivivens stercorigallinarum]
MSICAVIWEDGSVGKQTHLRLFASGLPELMARVRRGCPLQQKGIASAVPAKVISREGMTN